jgi:hypothetical protein
MVDLCTRLPDVLVRRPSASSILRLVIQMPVLVLCPVAPLSLALLLVCEVHRGGFSGIRGTSGGISERCEDDSGGRVV